MVQPDSDDALRAWLAQRLEVGLPAHLGVCLEHVAPGRLGLSMRLGDEHIAANGYLHAGAVVTLADTACGFGCLANLPDGATSFTTVELKSNFIRTTTEGVVRAEAQLRHGGRRTQVWDAQVQDEQERVLALFRCTQMILYK